MWNTVKDEEDEEEEVILICFSDNSWMLQCDPRSQLMAEILLSVLLSHVWGRKTRTSPCWENQRGICRNQSAIWQKAKCTFLQPIIPFETLSLGFSTVLMVLRGNKNMHIHTNDKSWGVQLFHVATMKSVLCSTPTLCTGELDLTLVWSTQPLVYVHLTCTVTWTGTTSTTQT